MTVALQSALVRIWDNENHIIGAGFLVTERHVLTCAHVVSDALDKPRQEMPTGPVQLDFPFVKAGERVTAVVTLWQPKRPDGTGDIAGLEMRGLLPSGARPLRLVTTPDTWDHPFRAFGFPIRHNDGVWASGVLRDRTVNGHIHIEDTKTPGYSVQPGFSGTPVWDETLHGVIGMVATAESKAETKAAFIIPTDKLIEAWPDLRAWTTPPNPYRGLQAFRQEDADLFFGREGFVGQLATAVANKPFVAVIGASGSGKSSVVFAGLLPRVGSETAVVSFRPGSQPFRALADALLPIWQPELPGSERLEEAGKLAANFQAGKTQLSEVVNDILQRQPIWKRLLLLADQFEELYTLCPQPEVKRAFVRCLVTAVQAQAGQHSPDLTLLLTMRADFMGQATEERPLADTLQDATYILGPMTREELAAAIEKPAQVASVQFEPGLIARILDDVGDEPGNLPLLEFALTLLWEQQSNGLLTHAAYETIGEVDGALAQYAEDQFGSLSQPEQEQARFIFTQLVQPGRGTEDTRRQATMSEIGAENWGLVKWLADARLVVTNRNEAGKEISEVVHEVLTRRWQRLRKWVNEDRRFREWQERLRVAMRQWQKANEDESALLRGALLAEAEDWLGTSAPKVLDLEQKFIETSIALREREKATQQAQQKHELVQAQKLAEEAEARRQAEKERADTQSRSAKQLRIGVGVLIMFLIIAFVAALIAMQSRDEAERARETAVANAELVTTREAETLAQTQIVHSQALAAESLIMQEEEPMRSLLLSIAAGQQADSVLAYGSLQNALSRNALPRHILRHTGLVDGAAWNKDESQILTWSGDGLARVWDTKSGLELLRLGQNGAIRGATWNDDESLILTWGDDGTARVWKTTDGIELLRLTHNSWVQGATWSADESQIITWSWDGTARVWGAASGGERMRLSHTSWVYGATLDNDESLILTWSDDNTARLWDTSTGTEILRLAHDDSVTGSIWNRDGSKILTWSEDGTARVWNTISGGEEMRLGHGSWVYGATWNENETQILTWSADGTARVWETIGGKEQLRLNHDGPVIGATWNINESRILTWSSDGTVRVWEATRGAEQLRFNHDDSVIGAAWSKNEDVIITWSEDHTARIWEVASGTEILQLGHEDRVAGAILNNGEDLAITWGWDRSARVWELSNGKQQLGLAPNDSFRGTVWNGDDSLILTWSRNGIVQVWQLDNGAERQQLVYDEWVEGAAWNKDNSLIVTWSDDATARLWEATSGAERLRLNHDSWVRGAAWNRDESLIATWSNDGTARIWDMASGSELLQFNHDDWVRGVAWSRDESLIATWSNNGVVRVWDSVSGLEKLRFSHGNLVWGAVWHRDDSLILTWSEDATARVWEATTGTELLRLHHDRAVTGAIWSGDGSRILTWSRDGTIKVWDTTYGSELLSLSHGDPISGAAWNRNESQILTWSRDGIARVWDVENGSVLFTLAGDGSQIISAWWSHDELQILMVTEKGFEGRFDTQMTELIKGACQRSLRNLTWQEWQLYFPQQPYRVICEQWPVHPSVPRDQR